MKRTFPTSSSRPTRRSGRAWQHCHHAASAVAWQPDASAGARAVLPLLAGERDLAAYVGLGAQFGGRLVAWGRVEDALVLWDDVVADCADRDVSNLADQTDRFAETLAAAKHYAD